MINGKIVQARACPPDQSSIFTIGAGTSARPGSGSLTKRTGRIRNSGLSLCSAGQTKYSFTSHPGADPNVYGQIRAQSGRKNQRFFSIGKHPHQPSSERCIGRFFKPKRRWTKKRTTGELSLGTSLIAWGPRSYLWHTVC